MAAPTSETITGPPRYTTMRDSTQYAMGHVSAEFAEALGMSGEEAESLIERAVRGADAPADLVPAA